MSNRGLSHILPFWSFQLFLICSSGYLSILTLEFLFDWILFSVLRMEFPHARGVRMQALLTDVLHTSLALYFKY